MKKIITLLLTLSIFTIVVAEERLISFSVGLCSAVPIYGSEEIQKINETLNYGSRVIIGSNVYANINPTDIFTIFTGAELLADIYNKDSYYSNHLILDFPIGIKIYPKLAGLCTGLSYNLGFKTDYFNTADGKSYNSPIWGNGFKTFIEYNFSKNSDYRFLPTVGLSWKHMPRGQNISDNYLNAYVHIYF